MAKLILLTAEKQNWVPKQIVEYAKKAKLDTEIIDPMECYIHLSDENYISYKGTKFTGADIVIPRLSEDNLDYKVAIINHLEKMGIAVLNSGQSMRTASNKIETQILLNANEIKTPKTALFTSDEQLGYAVESIGGKYPVIVKTVFGTHGVGVIRADSEASLRSIVQQLLKTNVEFMLQEYIEHKESGRILLLNGEVLSSVMRTVPESDFRSNAHLGAELKAHKPSKEEIEVCKKSAELLGIKFAAVDYIVDGDNIIVFEVNGSPGYESMQKVVDIDITEKLIDFCKTLKPSEEEPKEEKDQEDFSALSIEEGPTEEEEEEEEKTVDIDREVAKETDKKETKKALEDDDKVDVEVKSHHNIIDPERWDHEEENIIGTITSVVIKHFNDESPIEARTDTRSSDFFNFRRRY